MIREKTFTSFEQWTTPFVSEVAEIINLLKEYEYDYKKLAQATGLEEKNICKWTANYKKEPQEPSTIPYPCWCFLAALVGKNNIQTNGVAVEVDDIRTILHLFKPTAFVPKNKFVCPTPEQFAKLIDNENFKEFTTENISTLFNWNALSFKESLQNGSLPFLNWCLIIMMFNLNLQKMTLKELPEELTLD